MSRIQDIHQEKIRLLNLHMQSLYQENTTLRKQIEEQKQTINAHKKIISQQPKQMTISLKSLPLTKSLPIYKDHYSKRRYKSITPHFRSNTSSIPLHSTVLIQHNILIDQPITLNAVEHKAREENKPKKDDYYYAELPLMGMLQEFLDTAGRKQLLFLDSKANVWAISKQNDKLGIIKDSILNSLKAYHFIYFVMCNFYSISNRLRALFHYILIST